MPSNNPIFPQTPKISSVGITVANFAKGGTAAFGASGISGSSFSVAYTASSYGSRIDQIKVRSLGLNVGTVLRLFVNDGTNNYLAHETTLAATGATVSTITITGQTTGTNIFATSAAHGCSIGSIISTTSSVGTLTALGTSTHYYITSVPTTTTFTLSTLAGASVTVPSTVGSATITGYTYGFLESSALTDYDITITKGSDVASPIPYLGGYNKITATVGNMGVSLFNMGWQVTVHGGDY